MPHTSFFRSHLEIKRVMPKISLYNLPHVYDSLDTLYLTFTFFYFLEINCKIDALNFLSMEKNTGDAHLCTIALKCMYRPVKSKQTLRTSVSEHLFNAFWNQCVPHSKCIYKSVLNMKCNFHTMLEYSLHVGPIPQFNWHREPCIVILYYNVYSVYHSSCYYQRMLFISENKKSV